MPETVMADKPRPEALSLQHAAAILQVSEKTLRRWGKESPPRIVLIRLGKKILRVPRDEIARLRQQRMS